MKQLKTCHFKLNPTRGQEQTFAQWPGPCRYVCNLCLAYKKHLYTSHKRSISKNDIQKELSAIAKETAWIGCVHSQTLQEVTHRLFKAYEGFFKQGKGFPKFAKGNHYRSFTFKQGVKLHEGINSIQLPKNGKVKYRKSQPVEGIIKTASIIKEADGWYIAICCEAGIIPFFSVENTVGLDVGINSLGGIQRYWSAPGNPPALAVEMSTVDIHPNTVNHSTKPN